MSFRSVGKAAADRTGGYEKGVPGFQADGFVIYPVCNAAVSNKDQYVILGFGTFHVPFVMKSMLITRMQSEHVKTSD
jgi:hypothetical protein